MRKFIVSDLHGDGNIYKSIILYLESLSFFDEVTLYINGDLIDRGIESADMLLDIKKRMISGPFKLKYLGGNHELMMFQTYCDRIKGLFDAEELWYENGGWITDYILQDNLITKEKILDVVNFVANLNLYHKFEEKINGKNIVLVHAACPTDVKDKCNIKIKDCNFEYEYCVWARKNEQGYKIGNDKYFSIVGHTPNSSKYGYEYHHSGNYLNIDGGSAKYVSGLFEFDHAPLIEIKDGYLKILTFNHNNEIIYGNYFVDGVFIPLSIDELERERKYLNKDFKPKKLVKLPDNIIGYEDWYK